MFWVGGILATCLASRLLLFLKRTWVVFLCQSASATGRTNPTQVILKPGLLWLRIVKVQGEDDSLISVFW